MIKTDVLIIGGGISGLSTAWWLKKAGLSVQLWERDARSGGKIQTDNHDGYITEQAASIVMNFRPDVAAFIEQAGLESEKAFRAGDFKQTRYLINDGKLIPAATSISSMLLSPIWSPQGKLRLLSEVFIKAGGSENETVSEFVRRRFGDELLEKAIEPFIAGTLASDPDKANAYSVLPRLTALERKYGKISLGVIANKLLRRKTAMVSEMFSFKSGMRGLTGYLANTLGNNLHTQHQAVALEKEGNSWLATAKTPDGEYSINAQRIILCLPAYHAARLLMPHHRELGNLLGSIEYAPVTLVHQGYDRNHIPHPLDGTGFLPPRNAGFNINGNLWMSSLFEQRAPQGKALLTSYLGGARNPESIHWDDTRCIDTVCQDMKKALNIHQPAEMINIIRHQRALPLYHGPYYSICQQIKNYQQSLPGLHLEGNYMGGVSVRDRLANSRLSAENIINEIVATQPERSVFSVNDLVPVGG